VRRHFTSTAFVVREGRTLLHWHQRLQQWMPPGGHLLPDEDPVAGALREVLEETGLHVELIARSPAYDFARPGQLAAPHTILLEESADDEGPHEHIDLIYFCRPAAGEPDAPRTEDPSWTWVSADQLERREALSNGSAAVAPPEDVRALALAAIEAEALARGE
jgi:8-oxo-dGTP pyrophosphatase MutT (NUDIX family)